MEYGSFERTVKEYIAGCEAGHHLQMLPKVHSDKRQLFIRALENGFSCEQIISMLEQGTLKEETLPVIIRQKMNDNTSEIQA